MIDLLWKWIFDYGIIVSKTVATVKKNTVIVVKYVLMAQGWERRGAVVMGRGEHCIGTKEEEDRDGVSSNHPSSI